MQGVARRVASGVSCGGRGMIVRKWVGPAVLLMAWAGSASGDGWPTGLVEWVPAAPGPVFQGTGENTWDRKIRERGFILVEDGTYHLWYTGYNIDRSPAMFLGHATSPDGLRWSRDPANPVFGGVWTEDVWVTRA